MTEVLKQALVVDRLVEQVFKASELQKKKLWKGGRDPQVNNFIVYIEL